MFSGEGAPGHCLLVDHDTAATDSLRVTSGNGIISAHLVVVDHNAAQVGNLDSKTVWGAVQGGYQEVVGSGPIDRTSALVLCQRSGNHQPLIVGAVEIKVRDLEI